MTAAGHRVSALKKATAATVGGVRTRVIESSGAGPTVILLHGFSDSADGWRAVQQELADGGQRAVALDLPFFGRAARPDVGEFLPVLDRFVAAAARQYGTGDGVILVGNSVGGSVVLRAAQDGGVPLSAVVAIGPAGVSIPRWMRVVRRTVPVSDRLLALRTRPVIRGTVVAPAVIARVFASAVAPGGLSAESRSQYASHWGPGDLRRQLALGGRAIAELTGPGLLRSAPFKAPVTLVCGSQDWICPIQGGNAFQQRHPDVAIRILKGAGHCPQYDHPHAVAEIISEVIAACSTREALPSRAQEQCSYDQ
jgi:pimeloyl-ACP methyl ester carboxylesterase